MSADTKQTYFGNLVDNITNHARYIALPVLDNRRTVDVPAGYIKVCVGRKAQHGCRNAQAERLRFFAGKHIYIFNIS